MKQLRWYYDDGINIILYIILFYIIYKYGMLLKI